jgi:hypothetical protein
MSDQSEPRPEHPKPPGRRKPYSAPRLYSSEHLEAMAVACSPDVPGGPGKTVPPIPDGSSCAVLGS